MRQMIQYQKIKKLNKCELALNQKESKDTKKLQKGSRKLIIKYWKNFVKFQMKEKKPLYNLSKVKTYK